MCYCRCVMDYWWCVKLANFALQITTAMPVDIRHLIIHELEKTADSHEAKVFLSEQVLPLGERAEAMLNKLDKTFAQKAEVLQGYLSSPEDALFPGYLQLLVEAGLNEASFTNFSRDTMNALQLALQGVVGAKGGYLVYAHYEVDGQSFLSIFLVRDTEGLVFEKDTARDAFQLQAVTYLNMDKLALACRIHLGRYRSGDDRCVELIKHARSQKEISDYFVNWIGLDRPETSRDLTASFLDMVDELPLPTDEATGEAVPEVAFREQVLQFAMDSPHKTINLKEFDQTFYGNAPTAAQYAQDNDLPMGGEFRFDRGTLNKYYNHKAAADGLFLSFNQGHLQRGQVKVEGEEIRIHCPEMAEQVAAFLEGVLN